MKPKKQSEVISRLRCTAGHLNAIIEMVEAGQSCEQVLYQLGAVDSAIRAAGARLVICQAQSCKSIILDSPSPKQRLAELKRLKSLYTVFRQYPKHHSEVSHE